LTIFQTNVAAVELGSTQPGGQSVHRGQCWKHQRFHVSQTNKLPSTQVASKRQTLWTGLKSWFSVIRRLRPIAWDWIWAQSSREYSY